MTVRNDGIIEVAGGSGASGVELSAGGTLINTGDISASDTGGAATGVGVAAFGPATILNAGLTSADVAIFVGFNGAGICTIGNSGTIAGSLVVAPAAAPIVVVDNSGTITGDVRLAGGDDVYDGSAGALGGTLYAGAGPTA